jgi:hypothetical protein
VSIDQFRAHLEFFAELGIDGIRREGAWRSRADVVDAGPSDRAGASAQADRVFERPVSPVSQSSRGDEAAASAPVVPVFASAADALRAIRTDLGENCSRCKLHRLGRRQIVYGVGNPSADLMFVGEAPGADEDVQGEPFVGRAGQLLTKIIEAIGLKREDVYIANVIKCRPPENRNVSADRRDQAEGDRRARQIRGPVAAEDDGAHHQAARPGVSIPRRDPDAHLPSRVPAAEPFRQARRVGRHEARAGDPQRTRR